MNKRNRVVITGMGIVAPNGIGIEPFWESLLAGRSVRKKLEAFFPDFFHGPVGAEARHKFVGGGTEAEKLITERIFQDVPAFAAKILAAHLHARPQADVLGGDAIPGLAESC